MSRESAASHLVVLVHGLGQTEDSWRCPDRTDLVDHLAADPTLAPLLVRYNTGRSVVTNGQALADLLEVTVASWPVDVERITIIGHSLGGLVARSACLAATNDDHAWLYRVRDLITTGTPHTGAPAEKAANVAAWGLGIARVTRPLAAFTNRRSRGIKDLRFGAIHESDWGSIDPDALLRNAATSHRLPPTVAHHVIATTVAGAVESPAGWAIGDGMVRTASATAPRGTTPKSVSTTGGVAHGSIQRDERVVHRILDILGAGTAP